MSRPGTERGFDPELFTEYARQVGHGGALGILYVGHGPDWVELGLDWQEKLVGVPETGVLAPPIIIRGHATTWLSGQARRFRPGDARHAGRHLRPAAPGKRIVGRGECY